MKAATATPISREELFALVDRRRRQIRRYLEWAGRNEQQAVEGGEPQQSMRMDRRLDIRDAADAAELFPDRWWGVVVFTCFGSRVGTETVKPHFRRPILPEPAEAKLRQLRETNQFPYRSVGHHRIQSTLKGAMQALVAACAHDDFFYQVLHNSDDFDGRYRLLRAAKMRQWGRTTCFDLLLRAGALGIGGREYWPEFAYLAGSTGPGKGFAAVFGAPPTDEWAEGVLRTWADEWSDVAERVGIEWKGEPLFPRDQENFLCIYQEHLRRGISEAC